MNLPKFNNVIRISNYSQLARGLVVFNEYVKALGSSGPIDSQDLSTWSAGFLSSQNSHDYHFLGKVNVG